MKKEKLSLDQLKVKSFITDLKTQARILRGGDYLTQFNCPESWDCTGGSNQNCTGPYPCTE